MKKNPSLIVMIALLLISTGFISYQLVQSLNFKNGTPKIITQEEKDEQDIKRQLAENPNLGRIMVVTPIPSPCTDMTIYTDIQAASETPKGAEDVCTFDLKSKKFFKVPEELGKFKHLSTLGLRDNGISELSSTLFTLINLTRLGLMENNISEIPSDIQNLKNLQVLNLADNKLSTLPPEIAHLTNLEHLILDNNSFTTLPEGLYQLKNLKTLSLIGNSLSTEERRKITQAFPDTKILFE